jgi:hypothetical protein
VQVGCLKPPISNTKNIVSVSRYKKRKKYQKIDGLGVFLKKIIKVVSLVRIVRFVWFFTFVIFLVVIFLCYFQWPDPVGVLFNDKGEASVFQGKSAFFYIVNAVLIAYNLIFMLLNQAIGKLPIQQLPIPNKEFWTEHKEYAGYLISNWIRSLATMLNLIYILWMVMITYANLEQFDMRKPVASFWFLGPFLLLTVIIWTAMALTRFRRKKISISDNKIS